MDSRPAPLVSIVTPVYNGEPWLVECIESVLAQTYSHWEYLIVDNCSTDHTLDIAQRYAQQDARIRVLTNARLIKQFQNWNHALRQIAPESVYCKVLHADDWLFPECLSRMTALAEANPSVGVVSAYRLDEDRVGLDGLPFSKTVMSGREICRLNLLEDLNVFGSPTSLLIRSDLIRRRPVFYDETILHSDSDVCFVLLQACDFGFVHQVLTFTRRHNESLTALTHRLQTRRPAHFGFFLRYGPLYLSREEYQRRLEHDLESYYRFLAQSVFEGRDREFWDYQRAELKQMGFPVRTWRLWRAVLLEGLDLRQTSRSLRAAWAQARQPQPPAGAPKLEAVLKSMYSAEQSPSAPKSGAPAQ